MTPDRSPKPRDSAIISLRKEEIDALVIRLERAAETVQRLPRDASTAPAGMRSAWPEMVRKSRFTIEVTRRGVLPRPSPDAIDDLDRLALLLWTLTPWQRQLLWARACRIRWAELCRRQRRSRTTLSRDHRKALMALALAERNAESS